MTYSLQKTTTAKMDNFNIYVNADAIRSELGKKIADSNPTKTSPSPQLTVRDPVKIRSYRSVSVCLVLLCVLLLTAVIVLCVKFTQERKQLTLKNDNLTKLFENVTNERNQLMWEKSELQKNLNKSDGWIYYKFSLYFISSERKNWTESRRDCRDREADLIIINNKEKQDFLGKMYKPSIWIGLSNSDVEGKWKWVDGSTLNFSFWAPRESNMKRGQNCAMSYFPGWTVYPCYIPLTFICEINLFERVSIKNGLPGIV